MGGSQLLLAALALNWVNLLALGPLTSKFMMPLYEVGRGDGSAVGNGDQPLLHHEPDPALRKKFGIVHGVSMILELVGLGCCGAYLVLFALPAHPPGASG